MNAHKECVSDDPRGAATARGARRAVRACVEIEDPSNAHLAGVINRTEVEVGVANRPRLRSAEVQFDGHLSAAS